MIRRPAPLRITCQRGAALLTAMIIVTLVATLAVAMVWQQWRAVQVETAERARAQAAWILSGALEFARLILTETVRVGKPVALTDPWATPLAEARLSTFLAVDKSSTDEGPEAFLSGDISDAQGRFNLRNLVGPVTPPPGATPPSGNGPASMTIVSTEREALTRLCVTLGIDASVAERIAIGLLGALEVPPSASAYLRPQTAAQLTWFGIDPASVQALEPYVILLPVATSLNVNTASKEVLAAVVGTDPATAVSWTQMRQGAKFNDLADFKARAGLRPDNPANLGTQSTYFEVRGRLRLDDRVLIERSLVLWQASPARPMVLWRERVASLESVSR